jgi:hypothetical protein
MTTSFSDDSLSLREIRIALGILFAGFMVTSARHSSDLRLVGCVVERTVIVS